MLIILDASAIISFLISKKDSNIRDIIQLGHDKKITFIICEETLSELKLKISSNKIKRSKFYDERVTGKFIAWYKYNTKRISLKNSKYVVKSRDSKDDAYLQLSKVSKADFLITFDEDLLTIRKIDETKIATPVQFMNQYKKFLKQ